MRRIDLFAIGLFARIDKMFPSWRAQLIRSYWSIFLDRSIVTLCGWSLRAPQSEVWGLFAKVCEWSAVITLFVFVIECCDDAIRYCANTDVGPRSSSYGCFHHLIATLTFNSDELLINRLYFIAFIKCCRHWIKISMTEVESCAPLWQRWRICIFVNLVFFF